jgi:hypothetical protein
LGDKLNDFDAVFLDVSRRERRAVALLETFFKMQWTSFTRYRDNYSGRRALLPTVSVVDMAELYEGDCCSRFHSMKEKE